MSLLIYVNNIFLGKLIVFDTHLLILRRGLKSAMLQVKFDYTKIVLCFYIPPSRSQKATKRLKILTIFFTVHSK